MKWYEQKVSFYKSHYDNVGGSETIRNILLTQGGLHINTICQLRKLDTADTHYDQQSKVLKSRLPGFTPAALLRTREKEKVEIINRTNLLQLDFDRKDIHEYDLEKLKLSVFNLPFIGFCGKSCSGNGFYALALIAEPEKLSAYAEQFFEVFKHEYNIKLDTTKGRNPHDLRYLSYDGRMLFKQDAEPLKIKIFYSVHKNLSSHLSRTAAFYDNDVFVKRQLDKLLNSYPGNRTSTIQNVAHTLGGLLNLYYLQEIKNIIYGTEIYADDIKSFVRTAEDCFKRGMQRPLRSK